MDSLLFFLLAHMVLADHRSTVGGGGELRTTNAEHLIFATEECIMKMHCGPILRTTRRYCTMRNECVGDRQDDGSCVEITTQLNSTTIGDHNFCDHQPPSKQKQRTCNKLIKFIHGIKCKEVSPSIESNRVNVGKLERSTRREANSVRRLQFDDSVEQMRPNSIRTMAPVMDDDVTDDEVKKSGPMAEKMEMVAAHIMANDDKDDDNDDDVTDDGHVKAMDYLSKNHASRTSSPVTARIKTTTYNDNPHHLPEGTFLFVGIFSAMLLMIVIFALVLCRSRHTDNLVSELYAGGGKPPVTQQQQQQETTSSSTRRKQQSDHRVDAIVNNNNKNNKKNDHVFREEVLR